MLANYTDEIYLKGFVPELSRLLWSGETDYSKQKEKAEQIVSMDFLVSSYKALSLRPDLYLRSDTSTLNADTTGTPFYDAASRLRLAYNVTVRTGTTTSLTLQGSSDQVTWTDIKTISITATGADSVVFISAFQYYRINATITSGILAFTAWLTETIYDLFFAYKWLELILMNAGKGDQNKFTEYAKYFAEQYGLLWQRGIIYEDLNGDGTVSNSNKKKTGIVRMGL